MGGEIGAFVEGFPRFMIWSASAGAMVIAASTIYVLLTPWKELALVKEGNASAGVALASAVGGLAIPIASTLASSISLFDLLIWGAIALILQLMVYRLVDLLLGDVPARIEKDEMGAAIVLAGTKLSSAMILAAGLWDPVLQRF
ncbi:MAG: DUF350 domain-containing protein [Hyphomonas sp.]|nr:DUF350 domain-containing protein [Hyphomonas sp.]